MRQDSWKENPVSVMHSVMKRIYEPDAYQREVGSWWEQTATPPHWPKLEANQMADTVIIGAGYTGLNCALALARRSPADNVVILEANQPGWGASGRNGGFACMGGSKLDFDGHLKRFGDAQTIRYFNIQKDAVDTVRQNLERHQINADIHSDGETQLAHRPDQLENLHNEKKRARERLGIEASLIERGELAKSGMASPEYHGALTLPVGFALNPMIYVSGLAKAVQDEGIRCFGETPALSVKRSGSVWHAETPSGRIRARNLVIATNGYSSEDLPDWLSGRLLPVLTNIMVTRPIAPQELAAQGWTSYQMCHDTRNSLHYFHLLPQCEGENGPRMLFGMRGGASASHAARTAMAKRIRTDFDRIFPHWQSVETTHLWSGLACLTRDLTSFTGPLPDHENAYASLAYHGNGVAMGSHCGRLLARMICGEMFADSLPAAMRQPPRKFPLPALRRSYLAAAYKWYEWRDG